MRRTFMWITSGVLPTRYYREWRSPIAPRTCLATNAPTVASKK